MSGHSGNKLIKKELRNWHNTVCQRFLLIHNLTINPHSRMTALPKCVRQRNDTDKWFRESGNGLGWKEPLRITQSCHPAIPRTSAIRSGPSISHDFSMSLPRQFFSLFYCDQVLTQPYWSPSFHAHFPARWNQEFLCSVKNCLSCCQFPSPEQLTSCPRIAEEQPGLVFNPRKADFPSFPTGNRQAP